MKVKQTVRKVISVVLTTVMLMSIFSAAMPVMALQLNELSVEAAAQSSTASSTGVTGNEPEILQEIVSMRTKYTKYFLQSDGSYVAAKYAYPVHYSVNGKWEEINNTLTYNSKAETYSATQTDTPVSFPARLGGAQSSIALNVGSETIHFSPKNVQTGLLQSKASVEAVSQSSASQVLSHSGSLSAIGKAQVSAQQVLDREADIFAVEGVSSGIIYEDVYENIDIEYKVSQSQLKESIVIKKKQSLNSFSFDVDFGGLYPQSNADGSISLFESQGSTTPVAVILPAFMVDAAGAYSDAVTTQLAAVGNKYVLTLTADSAWLNSTERKYPVIIDPTVDMDISRANTIDCYVDNSQPDTSFSFDYNIYAGYSTLGKTRAFTKFNLPELPEECSIITNATLCFWQRSADTGSSAGYISVHKVTENWDNEALSPTWNDQPSYEGTVIDYAQINATVGSRYDFDITKLVKEWYEGAENYGIMLKSTDESSINRTQLLSAEEYSVNAYPAIYVTFRNNEGLESYWSYSSFAVGGTAYVNDYTGNLVYALPLVSSTSAVAPVNITAYYNNYSANEKLVAGVNGSSRTTPGRGFRLNLQQTVLPSSLYGFDGELAEKYPYIYTDSDGTAHYFTEETENGATVYKDEDGLGLTLTTAPDKTATYQITDKQDVSYYFNSEGNLFSVEDANGGEIHIYFYPATNTLGAKKRIKSVTDGAGHTFSFDYYDNNDYIRTITDEAGRAVILSTASGLLNRVDYPDGSKIEFNYNIIANDSSEGRINTVTANGVYRLDFAYTSVATGRRVNKIRELAVENGVTVETGGIVTFDRTKYNTTVIRSSGIDGKHYTESEANGKDDIVTTLKFDNMGRTVSQQVSYGNGVEIGAGKYEYTSADSFSENRIASASTIGKNTQNMLMGGNAESLSYWADASAGTVEYAKGLSSSHKYAGAKSIYLQNTSIGSAGARSYYRQNITSGFIPGKSYTLSAYIKTGIIAKYSQAALSGAFIQIAAVNSSGAVVASGVSGVVDSATDTEINGGWRRVSTEITLPEDTVALRVYLVLRNVTGTACFDGIQLEYGKILSDFNLLENASFEKYTSTAITGWTPVSITYQSNATGETTAYKKEGSASLRLNGEPGRAGGYMQYVPVSGDENETYIVSGWAAANAVNPTYHPNSRFEIAVRVTYKKQSDNSTVTQYKAYAQFNTTVKGWQYSSAPFSLKYVADEGDEEIYIPTHICVIPRYNYQANFAVFDHIQLVKDCVSTYTYDNEGNLISTAPNDEQQYNMEYDDNNNLISYTDTVGNKTTATYDDKHNLLTSASAGGLKTNYTYNSDGNVTKQELTNSSGSAVIRTDTQYSQDGAYVTKVTDQHGNEVTYTYDSETGALLSVTDSKGSTVNTYDSSYTKLDTVTAGDAQVSYSYQTGTNRLQEIEFKGISSGSPSEAYSFTYDNFGKTLTTSVGTQVLASNEYYSDNGGLKTVTYGNGDKRGYTYDSYGNTKTVTVTDNGVAQPVYSWQYDSDGTLLSHTDGASEQKYLYEYDSLGRHYRSEVQDLNGNYVADIELGYDELNNVNKLVYSTGTSTYTQRYYYNATSLSDNSSEYSKDNLPTAYQISGTRYVTYEYDSLNRLSQKKLSLETPLYANYAYNLSDRNATGSSKYKTTQLGWEIIGETGYVYTYDSVGNITGISTGTRVSTDPENEGFNTLQNGSAYRSYSYDGINQLVRENNATAGTTTVWEYDELGNIEKATVYTYSVNELGAKLSEADYIYTSSSGWSKLLTGIIYTTYNADGSVAATETQSIAYDQIGNPTSYMGSVLTWNGRQLTSNGNVQYIYDASGLRTVKYDSAQRTEYTYANGKLIYQETTFANGSTPVKLFFYYDSYGNLTGIKYNDAMFYAATNSQGDVIAIYHANGTVYARYEYDAWGNILSITDANGNAITSSTHIANVNPIRYRGYVYDTETGLYYVSSRYYDPEIGRWINADSQLNTSLGVLGCNMFAYCLNNPVNKVDYGGNKPGDLFDTMDEAAKDAAEYLGELTWENTWEYSTAIYTVNTTVKTYETVTKTHRFLWWTWTTTSTKTVRTKVKKYTYKAVKTDKKNNSVGVPNAPLFKKRVAALHTHPMGSWAGITRFSDADKKWADYYKIPLYVHGPNGELRKYDPASGEDILIYSDLPISPKTPWLE